MLNYFKEDLALILTHTNTCWDGMKNKTIFISGGTGFFGIWILMSFIYINRKLDIGSKIILLTRDKNKFLKSYPWIEKYNEISFLEGDIANFDFISGNIDYIIHAATEASVKLNLEEPLTMFETVVNGTKRILEFGKIKKVKSFLLTSSGAVYGKQPSEIENIEEDYIGAPITFDAGSVYGEGKRMSEVLCAIYHKQYNLPVKIARCYAFIGPFLPLDSHFAAGNFIKNLLEGEDLIIEGDGTPYRSYMYAADLMIWLWTILFKGENNRPYNVGSSIPITIKELAELVSQIDLNSPINIVLKTAESDKPPLRYVPGVNRAEKELKLKLYTDLKKSIEKTIKFNKLQR